MTLRYTGAAYQVLAVELPFSAEGEVDIESLVVVHAIKKSAFFAPVALQIPFSVPRVVGEIHWAEIKKFVVGKCSGEMHV